MSFTNRGKVGNALIVAVWFKGEDSHCGDANYEQSEMVNAKYYREVRQYQAPQHLIRFETPRVALTEMVLSSDMGRRNLLTHVHVEWHSSTVRRNRHVHVLALRHSTRKPSEVHEHVLWAVCAGFTS